MKLLKVAAAVLNQTPLAWDANKANILAAIAQARAEGVSLLCLPELCITGYGCEDGFHMPGVHQLALDVLHEILPHTQGLIVSVGLPLFFRNALFNTACLIADAHIQGFVAKRFLAGDGIHYEPRWFKAWPAGQRAEVTLGGRAYPLGDLHFDCGGVKVGFEICEDAWVATRPGSQLSVKGVDVILNPSASHFAFGKFDVRQRFVLEGSRAFGVTYVYSNLLGNEAGRAIYDGGAMIATAGRLVATGPRFSFQQVALTTAVVDVAATRMAQARSGSFRPDLDAPTSDCVAVPFDYPRLDPQVPTPGGASWEHGPHVKEEEFARAVSLALFDYMRKSRSRGFVVSLSGGADSAACACLVHLMARLASDELGWADLWARLAYLKDLADIDDARQATRALLVTAYQGTRNSSQATRQSAAAIAEAIGAQHHELDVDDVVGDYLALVEGALGRRLSWETDDLALQNIQARARAPGIWMFANLRGALLLATSNRSEAAVGYATMDGDTAGGLSPIGGIDKAFLRRWLRWLEAHGPDGRMAIAALAHVNALQPTAELRPPSASQTDEDDLMPYDLLDAIERAAIRDKRVPLEVYHLMRAHHPDLDPRQLGVWVERFFRLWSRNQWKRERYAPSFHLDDENLDPKTWCRFPILSGGFERELAELRAFVARGG